MKSTEYDTPPDQGLFLGTAGKEFFLNSFTDPPRGRPFGGGGNHRNLMERVTIPHHS
jgi:hypothetical protein